MLFIKCVFPIYSTTRLLISHLLWFKWLHSDKTFISVMTTCVYMIYIYLCYIWTEDLQLHTIVPSTVSAYLAVHSTLSSTAQIAHSSVTGQYTKMKDSIKEILLTSRQFVIVKIYYWTPCDTEWIAFVSCLCQVSGFQILFKEPQHHFISFPSALNLNSGLSSQGLVSGSTQIIIRITAYSIFTSMCALFKFSQFNFKKGSLQPLQASKFCLISG